jgi:hypothetical protein
MICQSRGSAQVDALSCGDPRAEGPPIALGMNRRTSSFSSSTPALDLDAYRIDSRASCVLLMRRHLYVHADDHRTTFARSQRGGPRASVRPLVHGF